jgi:hypothetical protein
LLTILGLAGGLLALLTLLGFLTVGVLAETLRDKFLMSKLFKVAAPQSELSNEILLEEGLKNIKHR